MTMTDTKRHNMPMPEKEFLKKWHYWWWRLAENWLVVLPNRRVQMATSEGEKCTTCGVRHKVALQSVWTQYRNNLRHSYSLYKRSLCKDRGFVIIQLNYYICRMFYIKYQHFIYFYCSRSPESSPVFFWWSPVFHEFWKCGFKYIWLARKTANFLTQVPDSCILGLSHTSPESSQQRPSNIWLLEEKVSIPCLLGWDCWIFPAGWCIKSLFAVALVASRLPWLAVVCMEDPGMSPDSHQPTSEQ